MEEPRRPATGGGILCEVEDSQDWQFVWKTPIPGGGSFPLRDTDTHNEATTPGLHQRDDADQRLDGLSDLTVGATRQSDIKRKQPLKLLNWLETWRVTLFLWPSYCYFILSYYYSPVLFSVCVGLGIPLGTLHFQVYETELTCGGKTNL